MITFLPPELLRIIVSHLSTPSDLARCCSTSKTFLSIAQPLLYGQLEFQIPETYGNYVSGVWTGQNRLVPATKTLLETLRCSPPLRQLVQKVRFDGGTCSMVKFNEADERAECKDADEREVKLKDVLEEILNTFPAMGFLTLDSRSHHRDLDEVIHLSQLRSVDGQYPLLVPAFSFVVRGQLGDKIEFFGAYERFNWIPWPAVNDRVRMGKLLRSSQDSLRSLAIPLNGSASLSQFHRLERLSLRIFARIPSSAVQNITAAVDNLPSLRLLILHGSAQEDDLELLLRSGLLARSLPPSLTHLCLAFKLTSDDLLPFLRDLPKTSNLKRLNCSSETGEMEGVVEEFSKRGIRLSFDKEWDI